MGGGGWGGGVNSLLPSVWSANCSGTPVCGSSSKCPKSVSCRHTRAPTDGELSGWFPVYADCMDMIAEVTLSSETLDSRFG